MTHIKLLIFLILISFILVGCQTPQAPGQPTAPLPTQTPTEVLALAAATPPTAEPQTEPPLPQSPTLAETFSIPQIGHIDDLIWSPDGQRIGLTARAADGRAGLFVYSISERRLDTWVEPSQPTYPNSPRFSPDGAFLFVATASNSITVWAVSSGAVKALLPVEGFGAIHSLAIAPDGSFLAIGGSTSSSTGLIQRIVPETGQLIQSIATSAPTYDLDINPQGTHVAATGQGTCELGPFNALLLDLANPELQNYRREFSIQHHPHGAHMVGIRRFGPRCEYHNSDVRLINVASEAFIGNVPRMAPSVQTRLSPNGHLLAVGDGAKTELWSIAPFFGLWWTVDAHWGTPYAFSPDGGQLALVQGSTVNLLNLPDNGMPNPANLLTNWHDGSLHVVEDFATIEAAAIGTVYAPETGFPNSLATLTKAGAAAPALFTFRLDATDRDQSIFVTRRFETPQDWSAARFIEVEVRGGATDAPLIVQLGELGSNGEPLELWKGSRFVSANGYQRINLLLETKKDFNLEFRANTDNEILDLNNIGFLSLGTTAHHALEGTMEIVAIRLFD